MALNLSRNTKVYFTTNVDANTGIFTDSSSSVASTSMYEIQVLDGYSFTQNTESQQITVSEAGVAPIRGSRSFNTALAPVDFSFTTYLRPFKQSASTAVTAAERVLWNALLGNKVIQPTTVNTVNGILRASNTDGVVQITLSAGLSVDAGDVINLVSTTTAAPGGVTATNSWAQPYRVLSASTGTIVSAEALIAPPTGFGTGSPAVSAGNFNAITGQWATGPATSGNVFSYTSTQGSQKHQLQRAAMIFVVDNAIYCIDNIALSQATVDFGIDQLATIAWTGQGTRLRQLSTITSTLLSASATSATSTAAFIANKLSTLRLNGRVGGADNTATATSYTVAITGGSITINNNLTYLTPANLGVVNQPVTYFTGTRDVSGSLTAYLKTGSDDANSTGQLLTDLLALSASDTEPKYRAVLELGGGSNATRVDFDMPGTMLQIPTVEVQDVVSTTINFRAQPFDPVLGNNTFQINRSNELWVRYYSAAAA